MQKSIRDILEAGDVEASAPCRIDMGGTLDISTFYYPLRHLSPCTFNIAINLKTQVRLFPYNKGMVKVSSKGFKSAEYPFNKAPFDHPLGLMFAIAAYFGAQGIHIDIDSSSPPRSALGGSSAAAVALVGALLNIAPVPVKQAEAVNFSRRKSAILAYVLESSVAGVPCGLQDQLAAAYGGVNAWYWRSDIEGPLFRKRVIVKKTFHKDLEQHIVLAYCGIPHESKNINRKWVKQFLSGKSYELWAEIVVCTQKFIDALTKKNFREASAAMNAEMDIRRKMTPDVLDSIGEKLVGSAVENNCGARFTGAGGGGCIWAIGEIEDICRLRGIWEEILSRRRGACLLDVKIDSQGLMVKSL